MSERSVFFLFHGQKYFFLKKMTEEAIIQIKFKKPEFTQVLVPKIFKYKIQA